MMTTMAALMLVSLAGSASGFRYTDRHGGVHLVERLEDVPPALRSRAEAIGDKVGVDSAARRAARDAELRALQLQGAAAGVLRRGERALHEVGWAGYVHLPSMGLGAGLVGLGFLIVSLVRGRTRRVLKLAGMAAVAAGVATGYATWIARATTSQTGLATPQTFIDEARRAADAMSERQRGGAAVLEQLERSD